MKRSRMLWDDARRTDGTTAERAKRWLNVVLYELQPFRVSKKDVAQFQASLRRGMQTTRYIAEQTPSWTASFLAFLRTRTQEEWMGFGAVLSYYYFVRLAHHYLDAGPLVLIVSGLVAIFTFGLGDDQNKEGLSAYSVFNRGFQRILGSVDADALLAQHVGMGMAAAAIPNQQAFRHDDDGDNHNNNNHNRGGRRRQQQQADNDRDREPIAVNGADDGNNRPEQGARKSGKKLRRKNQEHKVELRRQREAAIAMGFNGQGNREEMMAMQQLLEDQVRENERNMNGGAD